MFLTENPMTELWGFTCHMG